MMRKSNREITAQDELHTVMQQCDVCYLSIFDNQYPYIVPLSFGLELQSDQVILYFHCANEGQKLDLISANPHVGFAMSRNHRLHPGKRGCDFSMNFESICGFGDIEVIKDTDKIHGLAIIMQHYAPNQSFDFDDKILAMTTVLRLNVRQLTGKRLQK
jgi:nitroimidazol reductase NimA-like FMN-containing flavoprotein (pyridoxamine 5'-phosphate oxidase superfamily)